MPHDLPVHRGVKSQAIRRLIMVIPALGGGSVVGVLLALAAVSLIARPERLPPDDPGTQEFMDTLNIVWIFPIVTPIFVALIGLILVHALHSARDLAAGPPANGGVRVRTGVDGTTIALPAGWRFPVRSIAPTLLPGLLLLAPGFLMPWRVALIYAWLCFVALLFVYLRKVSATARRDKAHPIRLRVDRDAKAVSIERTDPEAYRVEQTGVKLPLDAVEGVRIASIAKTNKGSEGADAQAYELVSLALKGGGRVRLLDRVSKARAVRFAETVRDALGPKATLEREPGPVGQYEKTRVHEELRAKCGP